MAQEVKSFCVVWVTWNERRGLPEGHSDEFGSFSEARRCAERQDLATLLRYDTDDKATWFKGDRQWYEDAWDGKAVADLARHMGIKTKKGVDNE